LCVCLGLFAARRERRQSEARAGPRLFSSFVHSRFAGTRRAARASPHIASTPPLATRPCHLQDHPLLLRATWWRHARPGRPSQARQPHPFRRRRPDLNLVPSHHHHRCRRPAPNPASSTLTPCGGATVRPGEESCRGPLPARATGPLTLSPSHPLPSPLPPFLNQPPATSCAGSTGTATWTTVPAPGKTCGTACPPGRCGSRRARTRRRRRQRQRGRPTRCGGCGRRTRRRSGGRPSLGTWARAGLSSSTRRPVEEEEEACTPAEGRRRHEEGIERGEVGRDAAPRCAHSLSLPSPADR